MQTLQESAVSLFSFFVFLFFFCFAVFFALFFFSCCCFYVLFCSPLRRVARNDLWNRQYGKTKTQRLQEHNKPNDDETSDHEHAHKPKTERDVLDNQKQEDYVSTIPEEKERVENKEEKAKNNEKKKGTKKKKATKEVKAILERLLNAELKLPPPPPTSSPDAIWHLSKETLERLKQTTKKQHVLRQVNRLNGMRGGGILAQSKWDKQAKLCGLDRCHVNNYQRGIGKWSTGSVLEKLEKRLSPGRGFGLFTKQALSPGVVIAPYGGYVATEEEVERMYPKEIDTTEFDRLGVTTDHDLVISAYGPCGEKSVTRFINAPNEGEEANVAFAHVRFQGCITLCYVVTIRPLKKNQEILIEYGNSYWEKINSFQSSVRAQLQTALQLLPTL